MLEGGGSLHWSALESGIVRKVQAYIGPKLFGGAAAKTPVEGTGVAAVSEAFLLTNSKIINLGLLFTVRTILSCRNHRRRLSGCFDNLGIHRNPKGMRPLK